MFAAYHLSLETSFLADEGATLPRLVPFDSTGQKYLRNGSLNGHLSTQNPDEKESDSSPCSQTGRDESREESTIEEKSDNEQMRLYLPEDQREMMTTDIFSTDENQQSILVSVSSTYAVKGSGTVCEQSQLFRIKFYGGFDKPLGRYLREDLFGQVKVVLILNLIFICFIPMEAYSTHDYIISEIFRYVQTPEVISKIIGSIRPVWCINFLQATNT